jgi:hypothetical protein
VIRLLPSLIAVHGLKGSGKSVVANRLCTAHGYTVVKNAGALKDMTRVLLRGICDLSDVDVERCIEGDLKEVAIPALGGKSSRYVQQTIGTEYRDTVETTMWTRMAVAEMRAVIRGDGLVVNDDLRFVHEVDRMTPEGATFWMVRTDRSLHVRHDTVVLPWGDAALQAPAIHDHVLRDMVCSLLAHCGLPEGHAERGAYGDLADMPVDALAGKTPSHCLRMLHETWVPLMHLPWTASVATTAAHVSERPLAEDIFDLVLCNDGSITDLELLVDRAVCAEGT